MPGPICGQPELRENGMSVLKRSDETHLGGQLLTRRLSSGRFASGLLGTSHSSQERIRELREEVLKGKESLDAGPLYTKP